MFDLYVFDLLSQQSRGCRCMDRHLDGVALQECRLGWLRLRWWSG